MEVFVLDGFVLEGFVLEGSILDGVFAARAGFDLAGAFWVRWGTGDPDLGGVPRVIFAMIRVY